MRLTSVFYSSLKSTTKNFVSRIGLEIHARINTKTKIFSDADLNENANITANTNVSHFDVALPGMLINDSTEQSKQTEKNMLFFFQARCPLSTSNV
jgi:hypothetical protein